MSTTLVSPVADQITPRPLAERLPGGPSVIGLIDGTLNKGSLWGQGMLDAAESAIGAARTGATFVRIDLNPLENPPPERWVATTLSHVDGAVFSAGDCITCTSRSVRDAIWAEQAGLPSAIVCTGSMLQIVEQVCNAYGMPQLARYPVTESFFGRDRAQIAALTASYVESLPSRLVAP